MPRVTRRWVAVVAACAACAALLGAGAVMAQGGTIVAIVHRSNPATSISRADLRNIYLGREHFWSDRTPVEAYARPETTDAGRRLHREVLRMTPARFRHHWQGLQLSGRGTAPRTVSSPRAAIAQVAATRGGISILTEQEARAARSHVKILPIH